MWVAVNYTVFADKSHENFASYLKIFNTYNCFIVR